MTLTRTKPKKRKKLRADALPRCSNRQCQRIARVRGMCPPHAEKHADDLFREYIRNRDQRCTAEGMWGIRCQGFPAVAHNVGRGNHSVRWDPENCALLCNNGHHYTVDQHGKEAHKREWMVALLGEERYAALMARALVIRKRNEAIEAALDWLKEETG